MTLSILGTFHPDFDSYLKLKLRPNDYQRERDRTMMDLKRPWLIGLALLALLPSTAVASQKAIQGRTGLAKVREGKDNVRMLEGVVQMTASGSTLRTSQNLRLQYPGPPLERGSQRITVAVREDYFRSREHGEPRVSEGEARGFTSFGVFVDGREIATSASDWSVNEKGDTATRCRTWSMAFRPGQIRRVHIQSRAPLGHDYNRTYAQFVSQDLGGWRGAPNYLELRFSAPGAEESRLAALSPRPNQVNPRAVQWVYRNARPHRDVYLQMPIGYGSVAYAR